MEADWAVEIGADLPCIDADWEDLADLRRFPRLIENVPEAARHPALREALLKLNSESSPVFTTKCDAWAIVDEEIDPDEFAATRETAQAGFAAYIDILERDIVRFASFDFHERWARELAAVLRPLDRLRGRVDVVVRRAFLRELSGFGLTLYAAGCGVANADAVSMWRQVLATAVAATISTAAHPSRTGE